MWWMLTWLALSAPPPEEDDSVDDTDPPVLRGYGGASDKPIGALPSFDDMKPRISCCIAKEVLAGPVLARLDGLRECWEALPPGSRTHPTKVRMIYTLAKGDDRASEISIVGGPEALETCMVGLLTAMEWDRQMPCSAKVTYPILFADPVAD